MQRQHVQLQYIRISLSLLHNTTIRNFDRSNRREGWSSRLGNNETIETSSTFYIICVMSKKVCRAFSVRTYHDPHRSRCTDLFFIENVLFDLFSDFDDLEWVPRELIWASFNLTDSEESVEEEDSFLIISYFCNCLWPWERETTEEEHSINSNQKQFFQQMIERNTVRSI